MEDTAALKQRTNGQSGLRDDELAKLLPARETVVEGRIADGTQLSERVSAVRGTRANPMTRDEVVGKARDLTGPGAGARHVNPSGGNHPRY